MMEDCASICSMEHTFVVSGLVPGILGSLPSPRAEVQAKLASAVTRQRFIRKTKMSVKRWAKEKNWYLSPSFKAFGPLVGGGRSSSDQLALSMNDQDVSGQSCDFADGPKE